MAAAVGAKGEAVDFLRGKSALVLLDNFEHVIGAATDVSGLLASAQDVTVLVTSREPLRLAGEHEFALPPLPDESAAELFRSRAEAVRSDFTATPGDVAGICRRLEGLPLAIELAAARSRMLDAPELLAHLDHRLPLLSAGTRDAPMRQQTLRATIDWSYELLPDAERRLFVRLAVFAGGFTLEAAERVCGAEMETLAGLVDKSLVRRAGGRFSFLETIREYATERLEVSDELDELERLHALHYVELARRAEPELTGTEQSVWLDRIAAEHENLRAALQQLLRTGDGASALSLASALVLFWYLRGFYAEGLEWLERSLDATPDEASPDLARSLWGAGFLAVLASDYGKSAAYLERARTVATRAEDRSSLARTLCVIGILAFFRNDLTTARASFEESADIARSAGDTWCLADALGTLSSIYPLQGELDAAATVGDEALRLARGANDQHGIRMALFGLALAALRSADLVAARTLGGEGLAICREIGDPWFQSYLLWILASAACEQGDHATASAEIVESLEVAREIGAPLLLVCALEVRARLDLEDGDPDGARARLDEALALAAGSAVPASYVAALHLTRGGLARVSGDDEAARSELEQSIAFARECGDTWGEERALAALQESARR